MQSHIVRKFKITSYCFFCSTVNLLILDSLYNSFNTYPNNIQVLRLLHADEISSSRSLHSIFWCSELSISLRSVGLAKKSLIQEKTLTSYCNNLISYLSDTPYPPLTYMTFSENRVKASDNTLMRKAPDFTRLYKWRAKQLIPNIPILTLLKFSHKNMLLKKYWIYQKYLNSK